MDRFSRLLGAKKQDRIKSSNRMPTRGDGNDGDMMVVNGSLLIKDRGLWLKFAANIETSDGEGTVNATTVSTNTIQEVNVPHTVSSHTDTSVTGSQLTTLTGGTNADTLHSHTMPSHSITSHNDIVDATGAQLETLTGGSSASALHTHTVANLNDTSATAGNLDDLTGAGTEINNTMHIHDSRYRTEGELSSISGAGMIGVADIAELTGQTSVEAYLAENRTAIDAIEGYGISVTGNNGITISTNSGTIGADNLTIALNADVDGTSIINTDGTGAQIGIKNSGVNSHHYADDSIDEDHINWGTGTDQISAGDVPVADAQTYWTTDTVEGALDEIGAHQTTGGFCIGTAGNIGDGDLKAFLIIDDSVNNPCLEGTTAQNFNAGKLRVMVDTINSDRRLLRNSGCAESIANHTTKTLCDTDVLSEHDTPGENIWEEGLAIDLSINPTWTGLQKFSNEIVVTGDNNTQTGWTLAIGGYSATDNYPITVQLENNVNKMFTYCKNDFESCYSGIGIARFAAGDTDYDDW